MFCIQTPGAFVYVYSFLGRPGINWTTWCVALMSCVTEADSTLQGGIFGKQVLTYHEETSLLSLR